jgi:non-homologous end joining protein Ku
MNRRPSMDGGSFGNQAESTKGVFMAYRSTWTGVIRIGMLLVPVGLVKMLDDAEEGTTVQRLCGCCNEPFKQNTLCPAGNAPESQAALKRGDSNLTPVVYGVENGSGYTIVGDKAAMDQISGAGDKDAMDAQFVDLDEVADHLIVGGYYVKANDKVKGSDKPLKLLAEAMIEARKAAITQVALRGVTHPAIIRAVGNVLTLNVLPYYGRVREPDEKIVAHNKASVLPAEQEMAVELLNQLTVPFATVYAGFTDEAAQKRREAIEAAVAGQPIPAAAAATTVDPAADLLAALKASMA